MQELWKMPRVATNSMPTPPWTNTLEVHIPDVDGGGGAGRKQKKQKGKIIKKTRERQERASEQARWKRSRHNRPTVVLMRVKARE